MARELVNYNPNHPQIQRFYRRWGNDYIRQTKQGSINSFGMVNNSEIKYDRVSPDKTADSNLLHIRQVIPFSNGGNSVQNCSSQSPFPESLTPADSDLEEMFIGSKI